MKIDIINNITKLTAEENMALRHKDMSDGEKTTITEVWLSGTDSPDNWEDCEYLEEQPITDNF